MILKGRDTQEKQQLGTKGQLNLFNEPANNDEVNATLAMQSHIVSCPVNNSVTFRTSHEPNALLHSLQQLTIVMCSFTIIIVV